MCNESATLLQPPSTVRGMKLLDRDAFVTDINAPFVLLNSNINQCLAVLKSYLLKLPSFKPVQVSDGNKVAILDPLLVSSFYDIKEDHREKLKKIGINETDLKWRNISLRYENWKADEILKAVLPEDVPNVSGFSIVGHIIHLNLKDGHFPFKNVIGSVLLDKTKNIRTVVNKLNTIDNTYRNFSMEVLAGENDTQVLVKENGCQFEFDFAVVYWNPRLSTEHERVVSKFRAGDIVFDVFAGVGPFSIPAGKKRCVVYANDLNPESSRWLIHNAKKNNVSQNVHVSTLDGRKFITTVLRNKLGDLWREKNASTNIHIIMNLPALAVTFLDSFSNICGDVGLEGSEFSLPIVHCYCFIKNVDNCKSVLLSMVEEQLECCVNPDNFEAAFVRNVAPNKDMYRISFQLPLNVLGGHEKEHEPEVKKMKYSE